MKAAAQTRGLGSNKKTGATAKRSSLSHKRQRSPHSLQQTIGNQAFGQLLNRNTVQVKPTSGQQGDRFEQETDQVADQMPSMPSPVQSSARTFNSQSIQRKCKGCDEELQRMTNEDEELQRKVDDDEEPLQGKFESTKPTSRPQFHTADSANQTGMPGRLKSGLEALSGFDLSGIRVHKNSSKPAQVNALAYTQGRDIHVASGQDKHLPHEGWHAVQQMQGRVKPTIRAKGVSVNNDAGLEREADVMGGKALQTRAAGQANFSAGVTENGAPALCHSAADIKKSIIRPLNPVADGPAASSVPMQRYVDCRPVTMAGKTCPDRESGEVRESRTTKMELANVSLVAPGQAGGRGGWIIANFAIGSASIKANLKKHPLWKTVLKDITKGANKRWEILGFTDCEGTDVDNTKLRAARATAVFDVLPAASQKQIDSVTGEYVGSCITENRKKDQRSVNRAVLILHKQTDVSFAPEKIPPPKHKKPKPTTPSANDCKKSEARALGRADPLAKEMVVRALSVLNGPSSNSKSAVLKRHFGDDSMSTELDVTSSYRKILGAFKGSDVKYQCEHKSDIFPSLFCGPTTHGYVNPIIGLRVHICEYGFTFGDKELANTIIHELAHGMDFQFHPGADNLANFAEEVHSTLGPVP